MTLKQVPIVAVDATDDSPLTEQFNKYVHEVLEEWHLPGLSLSVVDGDKTYSKVYGSHAVTNK